MLQVVIPMAGKAQAFADRGYTFPKPLIELGGQSMIEAVVRNLTVPAPATFHFVCRKEHLQQFYLADVLALVQPGAKIIASEGETAGALCTVLLAADALDPNEELLIANGDQLVLSSLQSFYAECRKPGVDGCILTFDAVHPRWSYARTGTDGRVVEVSEKRPISRQATAGIYYFRRAGDFRRAAENIILKGLRTREQYFVCPVYNELLLEGMTIVTSHLPSRTMVSLGTPEDVEQYQARVRQGT